MPIDTRALECQGCGAPVEPSEDGAACSYCGTVNVLVAGDQNGTALDTAAWRALEAAEREREAKTDELRGLVIGSRRRYSARYQVLVTLLQAPVIATLLWLVLSLSASWGMLEWLLSFMVVLVVQAIRSPLKHAERLAARKQAEAEIKRLADELGDLPPTPSTVSATRLNVVLLVNVALVAGAIVIILLELS